MVNSIYVCLVKNNGNQSKTKQISITLNASDDTTYFRNTQNSHEESRGTMWWVNARLWQNLTASQIVSLLWAKQIIIQKWLVNL